MSRATKRLQGEPRYEFEAATHTRLVGGFVDAIVRQDLDALRALLADDVVSVSDGGGQVVTARRPILGPDKVARFFAGLARKAAGTLGAQPILINGTPGLLVTRDGAPDSVFAFSVRDGLIARIHVVRNPQKLRHITLDSTPT